MFNFGRLYWNHNMYMYTNRQSFTEEVSRKTPIKIYTTMVGCLYLLLEGKTLLLLPHNSTVFIVSLVAK